MSKYKTPLLVLAVALLVWSAVDFYHFFTIGLETLEQFMGSDVESTIQELVQGQLVSAVLKLVLAILCGIPFIQRKK